MIKAYGDSNWQQLRKVAPEHRYIPRRSRYGDDMAVRKYGMQPIEQAEYEGKVEIIKWDQLKDVLDKAHEHKTMSMYHQAHTWAPEGFQYNQDGIGYCWTWSGTACMMDCRAAEQKETIALAPVSMGFLVGWKDRGNYLESYIKGAREQGVAPASMIPGGINSHDRNPRNYEPGWDTQRANFRLGDVWDTNTRDGDRTMILHCATILARTARPIFIAYNWWGHALELVGMKWSNSAQNNVIWLIRNSHNERDLISLEGSRGVPDEGYGFINTILPLAA